MDTWNEHPRGALHAYLDGELSLEGSLEVEHHLSDCAACRRELETYRALRRLLQSAKATAPEAETALLRVTRTVRLRHRRRVFAAGGAMAMAAAAALTLMVVHRQNTRIVDEVASVHARALDSGRTVELASSDPAAIERWFSDRLPESVPSTQGGDGFALRGARVDSLEGRRVATVVYQVRNHLVDVFAWPSAEKDMEPRPAVAGRWTVCRWSHRGVAYWMVSDAGTEDLKALAALIKEQRT
ncbi:MAG TPA: zf-HC2 domain-containing protein [Myxococcaceae bacterium]|nr:zf-HC2 domain-containing protein [Myxococcaceae bacterium]